MYLSLFPSLPVIALVPMVSCRTLLWPKSSAPRKPPLARKPAHVGVGTQLSPCVQSWVGASYLVEGANSKISYIINTVMLSSITPCPGPRPQSFEVLHCWGHQVLREEVPWRKVGEESPLHYSILLIEHDSTVLS